MPWLGYTAMGREEAQVFFSYHIRIREAKNHTDPDPKHSLLLNTIYTCPESYEWVGTVAALVGKLCLAASFAVIYIHSGEIFPTTIRNSAMGLVSVAARCGGIVAPFIVLLGKFFLCIYGTKV
jgi:hypothetical protein